MKWLNVILGLWVAVSPFIIKGAPSSLQWSNVIVGIVVAVLAYMAMSAKA
ncbi:MAG TPA: SPW repeat protein [bacterium]|nr:SPW repeat protein [bacterium]